MKLFWKYRKIIVLTLVLIVTCIFNISFIIHLSINKQYLISPMYSNYNEYNEIDEDYGWSIVYLFINILIIITLIMGEIIRLIKNSNTSKSKSKLKNR